jgi:salicylate hydroxylase
MTRGRILIAGGGIGGLSAALALARRGFEIAVFERSSEWPESGAGLQLSPNAGRVLQQLGLWDAVAAASVRPRCVIMHSVPGRREVARLPIGRPDATPYLVLHRAQLHRVLLQAAERSPAITIHTGCQIVCARNGDGFASAEADNPAGPLTLNADAVIAADGVNSRLRQAAFGGPAAIPTGAVAWRGTIAAPPHLLEPNVRVWMAPSAHLVAYPIGGERLNLVLLLRQQDGATTPLWDGAEAAARLEARGWPDAARHLVAAAQLSRYPLATVPPLAAWTRDRIALLGDAAHAMRPFIAQGASMAIEDAAVLAACLPASVADLAGGLARYSEQRRARVERVVRSAAQAGGIYHLSGLMAAARDLTMQIAGGRLLLARQNWIYRWRPPQ